MVVDLCHVRQDGPQKFTASNVEYEHRAGGDRRSRLRNSQTFQECTTGNGRGKYVTGGLIPGALYIS